MPSNITLSIAGIVATYVFLYALAFFTENPREPNAVTGTIPFISPLVGMFTEKGGYYVRMRNKLHLPIYTLRVPGPPLYVVNSLSVIQRINRHILTVAFAPIQLWACEKAMSVSKAGMDKISGEKRVTEDGYLRSFPRAFAPATSPGPGLDALNRAAVNSFALSFDKLATRGPTRVELFEWVRHELFAATMDATYGPHNPFRHAENEKAWFDFESGIFTMLIDLFPKVLARKSLGARRSMVTELKRYFQADHHLQGSLLVQLRRKHNADFGLDIDDTAHTEVGQVAAGIVNTAPTAFWTVRQVLADPTVFEDCQREVSHLVQIDSDGIFTIDLAQVRTSCPILISTWQEVLRFHGTSIAARIVQEDTLIDNQYLLRKGGVVLIPNAVIHSDQSLWGPTVGQFDHKRFLKLRKDGAIRHPAAAFRGFGSGHVLCPGRHFASTEVLAFLALLLVRFDVRPVKGTWVEPKKNIVMDRACPLPKTNVEVELVAKSDRKWRVVFSDNEKGVDIVAEDLA